MLLPAALLRPWHAYARRFHMARHAEASIPQHPSGTGTYYCTCQVTSIKVGVLRHSPDVARAHVPVLPRLACPADTHTYLKEGSIPMIARRPIRTRTGLPHTTVEMPTRYLTFAYVVVNSARVCGNINTVSCVVGLATDATSLLTLVPVPPARASRCIKVFA